MLNFLLSITIVITALIVITSFGEKKGQRIALTILVITIAYKFLDDKFLTRQNAYVLSNTNKQIIYRAPTPEEEQAYMKEHHLIKLGNEYHWCGIKESKDILPITKALDMDCQNDFCRIQKYYDYVKKIPYERGTEGKDKNAVEVMEQWKGDCDERSDLLASMMLANGYKTILLYTKDHAFTALNIPNYESNENRSYVQYEGRKYYIAETTDPNGQIGSYNNDVMHSLKFIYDVNEKRVASENEIAIQLFK
jgi:hypothetical protein